jgi:hypothetical protein
MMLCQSHLDELRGALRAHGLGHLIKPTVAEGAQSMLKWYLNYQRDFGDYDPLASAIWNIWMHAVEYAGPVLYFVLLTDEPCFICHFLEMIDKHLATHVNGKCDTPNCGAKQNRQETLNWFTYAAESERLVVTREGAMVQ